MFWAGLIGLSRLVFVAALTILSAIFLYLILLKGLPWKKTSRILRFNFLEIILIIIIVFEIVFVFFSAGLRPTINFDALDNWALKGKLFYYQPELTFNSQSNLFLGGGSHRNYPLHVPLLMTWSYFWLGQVNDTLINLIFAFYYLALIAFVYFCLRDFVLRKTALFFTMLLATLPLLSYHGFVAYADLILCFYFTLAAICLFKHICQTKPPYRFNLFLAGLFTGLSTWVKNEGLMLAGVLLIVFLIYLWRSGLQRGRTSVKKDLLNFIFGFLLFFLPWIIFKIYFGFGFSGLTLKGPIGFGEFHPEVLLPLLRQVFVLNSFHVWPVIFILILLFSWRQLFPRLSYSHGRPAQIPSGLCGINIRRALPAPHRTCSGAGVRLLFLTIIGVLAAYFILYFFTPYFQFVLDGTIVGRNLLTILPISVFLGGLIIDEL